MSNKYMNFDFLGANAIDAATHASQVNRYALIGASMGDAAFESQQAHNAKYQQQRIDITHRTFNTVAEKAFPNEINKRWYLINEMIEVLNYPARPNLTYLGMSSGQSFKLDYIKVKWQEFVVYDTYHAATYFFKEFHSSLNFYLLISHMLAIYSNALQVVFSHYPNQKHENNWSVQDFIARELVDRLHRLSSNDVISGVQPNYFDSAKMYRTNGTKESLELLDLCYSRLEEIENGAEYRSLDGEKYIRPMPAPIFSETEAMRLNEAWERVLVTKLKDFYSPIEPHPYYYENPILLARGFTAVLNCMAGVQTTFGTDYSSTTIKQGELSILSNHIRENLELKNLIRLKGQMLAAISYVLTKIFDKLPDAQPLIGWYIRSNVNTFISDSVDENQTVCNFPDREPLFKNPNFLNSIFINNSDADSLLDETVELYSYANKIINEVQRERENGNPLPIWNFRRGYNIDGTSTFDEKYRSHLVQEHIEAVNADIDNLLRTFAPNPEPIRPTRNQEIS